MKIELDSACDSHAIYRYDTLTLRIVNQENFAILPIFFIHDGVNKKPWEILEGPKLLGAGEQATYILRAPSPLVAVMCGQSFYVEVRDLATGLSAISEHFKLPPPTFPGIQNPRFYYWTYDFMKNSNVPFAWDRSYWKIEQDEVVEFGKRKDNVVYLGVGNIKRNYGNWLMSGIQQIVDFPNILKITVKPLFSTPISKHPPQAVGIEIADGNKRVWILFTNETDKPVLLKRFGELNYALYFVPTKIGEWNNITVDILDIYNQMGWELPPERWVKREGNWLKIRAVNLLVFVAQYPGSEHGKLEAYYKEVFVHRA